MVLFLYSLNVNFRLNVSRLRAFLLGLRAWPVVKLKTPKAPVSASSSRFNRTRGANQCATLFVAIVLLATARLHVQVTPLSPIATLQAVNVTASRVAASAIEGPEAIERYDDAQIASTGPSASRSFLPRCPELIVSR